MNYERRKQIERAMEMLAIVRGIIEFVPAPEGVAE